VICLVMLFSGGLLVVLLGGAGRRFARYKTGLRFLEGFFPVPLVRLFRLVDICRKSMSVLDPTPPLFFDQVTS